MTQGHTIIDLSAHRKSLEETGKDAFEAYWREIGGGNDVPFRDAIDPARIAQSLGQIILIERIAPRQAKIRLAGQAISHFTGIEPRGMPLTCLFSAGSRDRLGEIVETLFDDPARIEMKLLGPRTAFRGRLAGEILFLPLRDGEGRISRAIGLATLPERRTTAPLRLEIADVRHARLQVRKLAPRPKVSAPFETADRAREALRRRESFRIVEAQ